MNTAFEVAILVNYYRSSPNVLARANTGRLVPAFAGSGSSNDAKDRQDKSNDIHLLLDAGVDHGFRIRGAPNFQQHAELCGS